MMKISKFIVMLPIIFVVAIFLYFFTQNDDRRVTTYMKDKYDMDSVIKNKGLTNGFPSDQEYVVYPKDHEDLTLSVIIDHEGSLTDNYARMLEADRELHQLKKVMPEIEKLGFVASKEDNLLFVSENSISANLYSPTALDIAHFEEADLDRFFALQKLIKQSGATIDDVNVTDMKEVSESTVLSFDVKSIENVHTKEELLFYMKKSNATVASYYENKKWASKKEKVENDRFTFDSPSGKGDSWFNCREMNQKGECTNIFVQIYFKDHTLTQANRYLEEDFVSIFTLFEKTIQPKASIEYSFIEESSDDSLRFTDYEIAQYASTAGFIKRNFQ
ncbi:hypothetical protein [Lysinibacillus fusiformis]|uniref:hypothetical protein n=2 Tax=Lysinibacillus TaxID=400634 RepID=UPI00118772CA|nr:hypothetical protein [Lysinibacillus fusiformis]